MTQTVWTTGQGSRYHVRENCTGLTSGQDGSQVQDYEVHPVEAVTVAEAEHRGKTACLVCGLPGAPS